MPPKKIKAPAAPLTMEEKIEAALKLDSDKIRNAVTLPIPGKRFEVGQEVFLGHLSDVVVVGVFDEGRTVVVEHTPARIRDKDKPENVEKVVRVVPAYELQVKGEDAPESFSRRNLHQLNYSQRQLGGLLNMVTSFGVDMEPDYQRGLVWTAEDKAKLIESIFQQVDIGKFVFRKLPYAPNAPTYEIVDGKQRLSTLVEFVYDQFPYTGRYWSQLSQADRGFIEDYQASIAQLDETYTRQQILDLFVRLNTGGRPMDPTHLERVAEMASEEAGEAAPRAKGLRPGR